MKLYITLFLAILSPNFCSGQVFHTKKIENAVFTNYHNQLLKPKLQKDFSIPENVLQHLMASKDINQVSRLVNDKELSEKDIAIKYFSSIFTYQSYGYNNKYSINLSHSILFQFNEKKYISITYCLLQDKGAINSNSPNGQIVLSQSNARWYVVEDSELYNSLRTTDLFKIIHFFGNFKIDRLEQFLTTGTDSKERDMKEMKFYLKDNNGINISKMNDLALYWGSVEAKTRLEIFFDYYPLRNFKGWTGPLAKQWFDNRNIRSYVNYKK